MSERHPSGGGRGKVWRRREPASPSRMRGGVEKEGWLLFCCCCFYVLPQSLLCFPVTKTSFREAAADAIELTRQSWREGDEWEQRDSAQWAT